MRKSSVEKWHDRLENSSVPLRKINAMGEPVGFASGCLGDYKNQRILLSSAHQALSAQARESEAGDWAILSHWDANKGDFYWFPAEMSYLLSLEYETRRIDYVDFSYAILSPEVTSYSQRWNGFNGELLWQRQKTIHRLNFDAKPRQGIYYGFAGRTKHVEIAHLVSPVLEYELVVVDDLRYVETQGDMHVFKLGAQHPGHNRFQGCSGAPIISKSGEVVALVVSGCVERNLIFGVRLAAYKTAINWAVIRG